MQNKNVVQSVFEQNVMSFIEKYKTRTNEFRLPRDKTTIDMYDNANKMLCKYKCWSRKEDQCLINDCEELCKTTMAIFFNKNVLYYSNNIAVQKFISAFIKNICIY